ncbi:MAG: MmcQ/YjbR family DNA-binding protein [Thalassotalea sp.]|nr:MmcQ/YjbR family DNA-binding protein [Thalassotalea sp.]MDG2391949.1 MmcQ/YjbR family DNA-binding protein [Thalassotalea sp.]
MQPSKLNSYLINKPCTSLSFPFGEDVSVFKVKNKMFALLGHHNELDMINLKCDADESLALQDIFPAIKPAYHMDKKHWISVYFDGSVPQGEIERLIDNSYMLVVSKMTKKEQASILIHLQ